MPTVTYPEVTYPTVRPPGVSSNSTGESTNKSDTGMNNVVVTYPTVGGDALFDNSNPNAGYTFWFSVDELFFVFPVTPGEVTMKIGSKNETIDLINMGEVNIIRGPSLVDIEFEIRYPMRQYPYSRGDGNTFFTQWEKLKDAKENKKPIDFGINRPSKAIVAHNGYKPGWNTQLKVTIEDMDIKESFDEGDDVLISFKLKQWKNYGVVKITKSENTTSSSTEERPSDTANTDETKSHEVVYGDTLWGLAQKYYGDGTKYTLIYDANKDALEQDAKDHGYASSSNGNVLFPDITLTIPALTEKGKYHDRLSSANQALNAALDSSKAVG